MNELLDLAPCGFVSFTDDGKVTIVNRTLLEMLGYERAEVLGRHVETLFPIASRIFYQTHLFPLLKLHGRADEIYLALRSKSGEDLPLLLTASRREREGQFTSDCVLIPMRQRRKYEDELLRAKKVAEDAGQAKVNFLSMMSHELRTPLNAVLGYVEIMAEGLHGPVTDKQREDLRRIETATRYLIGLINDILNFTRLDAGQVDINVERVPLDLVLAEAESLMTGRFADAGIEFSRTPAPGAIVITDPERLTQIVLNLLTNAWKFTARGGQVSITSETQGDRILLRVRDTGRGIPADKLEGIFEPFVQVDRERTESSKQGVGLGLAISRDLARAMDAELTVESTVGVGSTFTIDLPLATQQGDNKADLR